MFASDRISTMLGAPPNHWKAGEVSQVKQIHRCYRNAFNRSLDDDNVDVTKANKKEAFSLNFGNGLAVQAPQNTSADDDGEKVIPGTKNLSGQPIVKQKQQAAEGDDFDADDGNKRDEEWYLPKDSPLRSKNGDKKSPLNPTFKDFETFQHSCDFDFWRDNFELQAHDRFLADTAQTIVANICNAQARNELRVKHGKVPLRKKREHITPLALMLHEMKLWSTNILRCASVNEEDTYKDLRARIAYLEGLAHKEVWGDAAVFLAAGMSPVAHDKLFRLLLTTKEALTRAQEYAYRGYCRRSSREKLQRLSNLLKLIVTNEMRLLSNAMTLEEKLSSPKTKRLQPTDLLNSLQNQTFVDYKNNLVNVLMYRLCKEPLVKGALTSNYEDEDVKQQVNDLANWTDGNLFCKPDKNGLGIEPEFLMDGQYKIMPAIYTPTANELKKLLNQIDPRSAKPLTAKQQVKHLLNAFENEECAGRVMKLVMKNAAAIQELIPSLYAIYQLWGIAGDGGDFTVYDTLREEVIRVMSNTIERVYTLQTTQKTLLKEIGNLCKEKEKAMELRRLKTGKAKYKPAWIMNYKFLHTDLLPAGNKGYSDALKQLWEIAKDAWDYNLTAEKLDDKVSAVKKMCDALVGPKNETGAEIVVPSAESEKKFEEKEVLEMMKEGKKDWLHAGNATGDEAFGQNNAFDEPSFKGDFWKEESNGNMQAEGGSYNPFADGNDSDEY